MLISNIPEILAAMETFLGQYPTEEYMSITVLTRAANRSVEVGIGFAKKDPKHGYFPTGEFKSVQLAAETRELKDFLDKAITSYLDKDDFVWILSREQAKALVVSLTDNENCTCVYHRLG